VANARVWDGQKVLALSRAGEVMAVAGEGGVEVWRAGAGVEGGFHKKYLNLQAGKNDDRLQEVSKCLGTWKRREEKQQRYGIHIPVSGL